jgi:hypothetical protein
MDILFSINKCLDDSTGAVDYTMLHETGVQCKFSSPLLKTLVQSNDAVWVEIE